MDPRLRLIVGSFAIALAAILLREVFATAWSNRCDPGNEQFFLMKNDPVVSFHPAGELFTWENDGPDNSWRCSDASLSVSHVGPNLKAMFEATRSNMTVNGWSGGEIFMKDQSFGVYQKTIAGVTLNAIVQEEPFWVEVDMNAPGLHLGESAF